MTRNAQFAGIAGLILLLFSIVTQLLVGHLPQVFTVVQFGLAALLLLIFIVRGGLTVLRSAAVKRAAGFGAGVAGYSLLFVALLIVLNYAVLRYDPLHYDSTEQKIFTLAPQTVSVLQGLHPEVEVLAFFIGGRVEPKVAALLERMAKVSPRFNWRAVDPEKELTLAEKLDISEPSTLHFTLRDGQTERKAVLSRELTEQQIVNELIKLNRGGKPMKVYYLRGHGEPDLHDASEAGYSGVLKGLEEDGMQALDLTLGETADVPSDADLLFIIAPRKPLLPAEFAAVERYLEQGGSAVFLSESHLTDDLARLAAKAGIEVGHDVVVDHVVRAFEGPTLGLQPMVTEYGLHQITRNFKQGTVYSLMSSVRAARPQVEGRTVTELAFTGKTSWAERNVARVFSGDPRAELDSEDLKGPVSVAAASEGSLKAPNGRPQRVVVIGDADFAANVNIRQLFNRDFLLNCLNWAVGEEEGVTIRERTMRQSTKAVTPEQFSAIFLLTAIILPELLLILGLSVWWYRKSA